MDDDHKAYVRWDCLKLSQEFFYHGDFEVTPTKKEIVDRAKYYAEFVIGDEHNAI